MDNNPMSLLYSDSAGMNSDSAGMNSDSAGMNSDSAGMNLFIIWLMAVAKDMGDALIYYILTDDTNQVIPCSV